MRQAITAPFVRHGLFWLLIILFFLIGYFTQPEVYALDPVPFLVELVFASLVTFLIYTYSVVYGLLPLLFRRAYSWFAIGLLCLNVSASLLYDVLGYIQQFALHNVGHSAHPFTDKIQFVNPILSPILIEINVVAGLMAGIYLFNQWHQKLQESEHLERQKLQSELQLLRIRLNPELLFGSLRVLHTLTTQQPNQAPPVVLTLAHLLRYVLYESQTDEVPLQHDLEAMQQYIALETTRFGSRIDVAFEQTGPISEQTIAPLLWLPLLENIFQYSIATAAEQAWISLSVSVAAETLIFRILHNCTPTDGAYALPGDALSATRKQLDTIYPARYDLQTQADREIGLIVLTLRR